MRTEFTAKTRLEAFTRSRGRCEECKNKLFDGEARYDYDHVIPDGLCGDNSLGNCMVLCRTCHKAKTRDDVGKIAEAKRRERGHAGIRKPRKITAWRRFDGSIRRVERER
jgi:5-methylcytosine-specific restriction endonuclease McrA